MLLLLLAVQTLLHLYATSALTSAADSAAQQVASEGGHFVDIAPAEAQARSELGSFGSTLTTFDWLEVDGQQVRLRVTAVSPGLLPLPESLRRITRLITVRTERFR